MKVTFLDLYNEEISDLLALEDQSRFTEDGKCGAVIRGLEEVVVYSPSDIYSLLECGSARRRTADTELNKQSRCLIVLFPLSRTKIVLFDTTHSFCTCSRSHAVFSIYIHVKETTVRNEELMKCGRLNHVDLVDQRI
jgi:kinesin family member 11